MNSRTLRIAVLALAGFGVFAIARLGYNLYGYSPAQALLSSVEGSATAGLSKESPLSFGPQGFYSRSSVIYVTAPKKEFGEALSASLQSLKGSGARLLHQKERNTEGTRFSVVQAELPEKSAEELLQRWKSQYEVLQFEENRSDRNTEYASLDARLESLQQTRTRITISPEQFKLSASSELGEEYAKLQTKKREFENARIVPPQQSLTAVFIARPGFGFAGLTDMILDALWWSIALFGALSILGLFAYLVLRLFQGGKDLLSWIGARLDPQDNG
ncbi:MAG: hypothetical protein KDK23_15245 [Leptospiraceae bacterium]|nr:hypothetical protein [Leptospiraceae bacterium]